MKVFVLFLALALVARAEAPIRFHTARPGFVSLNIYRPDGALACQLLAGAPYVAGDHEVSSDASAGHTPLPPGNYTWRALFHEAFSLKARGSIGDFGGDRGAPSAAAADDTRVYLGWSLATADADAVVACDPAGVVRWTHHRGPLSGCRALAIDAGALFVLGGEGADAEGRALYKLSPRDGAPIPWPDGRIDLKIVSLWPAHGKYKPDRADYMAVKNGRIYLSFTAGQFIAVLDAKTGAYLQTIVGAPPGAVDSVPTKCDAPDKPGALIDSDFVVIALQGGSIGTLLLAHDPIWVLGSDLTPLEQGQHIDALTMIGDSAKHHSQDIFVGLGPPMSEVQARPALNSDKVTYIAGKPGGRAWRGTWQPDRLGEIRALALDATGQLWVAESGAIPGRVSVWTTDGPRGRLAREYFAPPDFASPVAVNPIDPSLIFAGGCEWRVDSGTGRAACLGVITHDPFRAARFVAAKGNLLLVLTPAAGPDVVFERAGDGDYRPHAGPAPVATLPKFQLLQAPGGPWRLATADGFDLGPIPTPTPPALASTSPLAPSARPPEVTQLADGRIFITAGRARICSLELAGIDTLRPLISGTFTIPPAGR